MPRDGAERLRRMGAEMHVDSGGLRLDLSRLAVPVAQLSDAIDRLEFSWRAIPEGAREHLEATIHLLPDGTTETRRCR